MYFDPRPECYKCQDIDYTDLNSDVKSTKFRMNSRLARREKAIARRINQFNPTYQDELIGYFPYNDDRDRDPMGGAPSIPGTIDENFDLGPELSKVTNWNPLAVEEGST